MYRRFLLLFGATLVGLLLTLAAFAWLVDPFACNGWIQIPGFNAVKTRIATRLNKTMHVSCHEYDAMVFGTSRAGFIVGNHPAWKGFKFFSFALPGSSMNEARLALEYAQRIHPLKRALIGLDFFMFGYQPQMPDSEAAFISATRKDRPNLVDYTLTMLALSSAVETVSDNLEAGRVGMMQKALDVTGEEGHAQVPRFQGQFATYLDIYTKMEFRPFMFDELRKAIALCRENHTELALYMSPTHAAMMEIIHERGRWKEFEDWKREVTQIAWNGGVDPIPLYDFSGYNAFTTEPVPTEANHFRAMKLYFDSSHFGYPLGSKVLDRIWGSDNGAEPEVPGFGVRLTPDTVEQDIADNRARREAWLATHPPVHDWVYSFAASRYGKK